MACPHFYPIEEVDFTARPRPARAPLGTIYDGLCHAMPEPASPPERLLYEQCNYGYGRRVCPWFPQGSIADAVRFTTFKGSQIYILERDCSPVEHGRCDDASALESPVLARQALVFARHECPTT